MSSTKHRNHSSFSNKGTALRGRRRTTVSGGKSATFCLSPDQCPILRLSLSESSMPPNAVHAFICSNMPMLGQRYG